MTFTLHQLQKEQVPWVKHNFGDRPLHQPLLGLIEELGELSGALHGLEGCIGDVDWSDASKDVVDAIADITVFLCDYASGIGASMSGLQIRCRAPRTHIVSPLSLEEGRGWAEVHATVLLMLQHVGGIAHHHLKSEQGIRGTKGEHYAKKVEFIKELLHELVTLSSMLEVDFIDTVEQVWAEVKRRDWKKNPGTADVDARA
jgi:NTP pyrophosphatase (non-canonical NTP hydrolase)